MIMNPSEPVAHARHTDVATSHLAARSVEDLNAKQRAVLKIFENYSRGPLSDELLIVAYHGYSDRPEYPKQSPSGLRSRRSELVRAGLLVDSGHRGRTASGRSTILWKLK